MTHKNYRLKISTEETEDGSVYYAFAVLSISDSLLNLEQTIVHFCQTLDEKGHSHARSVRTTFEDKAVFWFLLELFEDFEQEPAKIRDVAKAYAVKNACVLLSIEKVCDEYPALYWTIVNQLPESEANTPLTEGSEDED
jgi:hypothetical protein